MKEDTNLHWKQSQNGKVIIFSAPSGSGKTTIVNQLLRESKAFDFSISACTRSPRTHEIPGKDYYFLSPDEFREKIRQDAFIEWEEVYPNRFYGTLKSEVYRIWQAGKHALFDVDVKGGLTLKNYFQSCALAIFVAPPSMEVLEQRLRDRDTDSEESIRERLSKARYEITFQDHFDEVIVNDQLDNALSAGSSVG
ncbi:MAG: guanylate kinase [Bacteroidia bacterium]|nr:guanylate kinase [Bacteroidia bacterium]